MSTYSEYMQVRIRAILAELDKHASLDQEQIDNLLDNLGTAQRILNAEHLREAKQAQLTMREQLLNPPDWPPFDPGQAA